MKYFILFALIIPFSIWGNVVVFTPIGPISFLVEKIGGGLVEVNSLIPEGTNPHSFTPSPRQIKKLNSSDIYFSINAPFEAMLIKRIKKMDSVTIIDLSKETKKRFMDSHQHTTKRNESTQSDPHIWLSPLNIEIMLKNISSHLKMILKKNEKTIDLNYMNALEKLKTIKVNVGKELMHLKGRNVLVFHPSFGYFLEAFGLHQKSIEMEGKDPTIKQIRGIIKMAKKEKIKIIFTQPQFSRKASLTIAKGIGGNVTEINPLEYDLFKNLKNISNAIRNAYQK